MVLNKQRLEPSHQDYLICINDHFHDVNFIQKNKTLPTSDEPILSIDINDLSTSFLFKFNN